MIYILPMFGNVLNIILFETKPSIKVVSFYVQDQLGFQIEDHCLTRFDVTSPLAVSKLSNELRLESLVFEVSLFALFYVPSWFICFWATILEAEHMSGLVLTSII